MVINKNYLIVIFLIQFGLSTALKNINFVKVTINGSNELSVTEFFRNSFLISHVKDNSLIKCASICSIDSKCFIFVVQIEQNKIICEFFSSVIFSESEIFHKNNSKIYQKFLNHDNSNLNSSTCVSIDTQTTFQDNFISNCVDKLSYFSSNQNKCVKCKDGWVGFKNICYQGFTQTRTWQGYVDYCLSLNSTLLIADDIEKFNFFQNVSKNLTNIGCNQRTWVNAKKEASNEPKWMNSKPINSTFLKSSGPKDGCYVFSTSHNSLLRLHPCSSKSHGICEYTD